MYTLHKGDNDDDDDDYDDNNNNNNFSVPLGHYAMTLLCILLGTLHSLMNSMLCSLSH